LTLESYSATSTGLADGFNSSTVCEARGLIRALGISGLKILPVVSQKDVTYVEGVVTLEDILRVYGLHEE
jgi:hypothetical protein